jgi:hypothetical protein
VDRFHPKDKCFEMDFSSRRLTSSLRKQANFHSRSESIPSEG